MIDELQHGAVDALLPPGLAPRGRRAEAVTSAADLGAGPFDLVVCDLASVDARRRRRLELVGEVVARLTVGGVAVFDVPAARFGLGCSWRSVVDRIAAAGGRLLWVDRQGAPGTRFYATREPVADVVPLRR